MIPRRHYSMLMEALSEACAHAENQEEFNRHFRALIMTSYEINTDRGRSETLDVTDFIVTKMGDHWKPFAALGIEKMEFVSLYLDDHKILETGALLGNGEEGFVSEHFAAIPTEDMREFAKWTTIAMRDHDIDIFKKLVEGVDGSTVAMTDDFTEMIREFLAEELEETVSEFQSKLDKVFGIGDLIPAANWAPPEGGDAHDFPPPV
jgi:hypothetical protein